MEYRDERDALRARLESLETELASARAENERMQATENALLAARRENEALRAELGRLGPGRKRTSPAAFVLPAALLVFVAAGGVFLLIARAPAPPPPLPPIAPFPAADEPPPPAVAPSPEPAPKSPRHAAVEWKARVVKSTGLPYAAGTPCTVRGTLASDGTSGERPGVSIACAGKVLYDSAHSLSGMANMSYEVEEVPGETAGAFRYALRYEDQGPRTGERTQASVASFERTATAWKETAPAYRVELALEELSEPSVGAALFVANDGAPVPFRKLVRRRGTVSAATGTGLVRAGDACDVELRPAFGKDRCRAWVQCAGTTLYGAGGGGFAECSIEGDGPFAAKDGVPSSKDQDPVLELALGHQTLTVSDDLPNAWSVNVTLGAP